MAVPNPLRALRRARPTPQVTLERQRDDLPKTGLFTEPIRLTALEPLDPEVLDDGRRRATFLVEVRDADDRRCPELSVEARISGPDRTRTVQGNTDLFGRIRFRMAGPAGTYGIEVTDVAAFALDWARDAAPTAAELTID